MIYKALAVADLNDDGYPEIVIRTHATNTRPNNLFCFDNSGALVWRRTLGEGQLFNNGDYSSLVLDDIDGDGICEIISGSRDGKLYCFDNAGAVIWSYDANVSKIQSTAVADLNNDGFSEIILASTTSYPYTSYIHCLDRDGQVLWFYQLDYAECYSSPVITDIDLDGDYEICVGFNDRSDDGGVEGGLWCLDKDGREVWVHNIEDGGAYSIAVADLDGNGYIEFLFGILSKSYGYLQCVDKDGEQFLFTEQQGPIHPMPWPMFQHDLRHTGLYTQPDLTPPTTPTITDEGRATTYTDRLYASWTSDDPETGIAEYQYRITVDSPTDAVIRDWTSAGTDNEITAGALDLEIGETYYFGVKAKNGDGFWSDIGYSDGIKVTAKPEAVIDSISPSSGRYGVLVTLTGSGTDDDGEIEEYQWRSSIDGVLGNTDILVTSALSAGTHTIYFKVKDDDGIWSEEVSATLEVLRGIRITNLQEGDTATGEDFIIRAESSNLEDTRYVYLMVDGSYYAYDYSAPYEFNWNTIHYPNSTNPPPIQNTSNLIGDTNGDGVVSRGDVVSLLRSYGSRQHTPGDINADDRVGLTDLALLQQNLGATLPEPPPLAQGHVLKLRVVFKNPIETVYSDEITVNVFNENPVIPTIEIIDPQAAVEGQVSIGINVNDVNNFSFIDLRCDDVHYIGRDQESPISITWDTIRHVNEEHTLQARGYHKIIKKWIESEPLNIEVLNATPDVPVVSITNPTDGATVDSTIIIQAAVSHPDNMSSVSFSINDNLLGYDSRAPFELSWPTGLFPNGEYVIKATSSYKGSWIKCEDSVTVTVNNTFPPTPPSVSFDNLTDNQDIQGTYSIVVTSSDPTYMKDVRLFINDELFAQDTRSPYVFTLPTYYFEDGTYTLKTRGYHSLTEEWYEETVDVNISNGEPAFVPTLSIDSHENNQTVSGTETITGLSNDSSNIMRVYLYCTDDGSGSYIGHDRAAPYTITLDTTNYSNQAHTFKLKAYHRILRRYIESPEITLNIQNQVATPVITPNGGIFTQPTEVSITTDTEGSDIYYTLDGSEPTDEFSIPIDEYTTLLMHYEGSQGSTIFTDEIGHAITPMGNAHIDTSTSKFGVSSVAFDGTEDCVLVEDSPDWHFGTEDFTIEFWIRLNNILPINSSAFIISQSKNSNNEWYLFLQNNAGGYYWNFGVRPSGIAITSPTTIEPNTWYHISLVRDNNTWRIYQDGTQLGEDYINSNSVPDIAADIAIGAFYRGATGLTGCLDGNIDEVRISKGVARWTGEFTPPSVEYGGDW